MKRKLRISTTCSLHYYPKDDINEYFRRGLDFYKRAGFDALDCPVKLLTTSKDHWKARTETLARDAKEAGIRFEICHLPYDVYYSPWLIYYIAGDLYLLIYFTYFPLATTHLLSMNLFSFYF